MDTTSGPDRGDLDPQASAAVDAFGRSAGAALRRQPPERGIADIRRAAKIRQTTRLLGGAGVAGLLIAGATLLVGNGSESTLTPDSLPLATTPTSVKPSTTPTTPPTEPTLAPDVPDTTIPADSADGSAASASAPADEGSARTPERPLYFELVGTVGDAVWPVFDPTGARLTVSAHPAGSGPWGVVRQYDATTLALLQELPCPDVADLDANPERWLRGARAVLALGPFEITTSPQPTPTATHEFALCSLRVSPDERVATQRSDVGNPPNNVTELVALADGARIATLPGKAPFFSLDSGRVTTTLGVFSTVDGAPIPPFDRLTGWGITSRSDDATRLVVSPTTFPSSDGLAARVIDVVTGSELAVVEDDDRVARVWLSGDGTTLGVDRLRTDTDGGLVVDRSTGAQVTEVTETPLDAGLGDGGGIACDCSTRESLHGTEIRIGGDGAAGTTSLLAADTGTTMATFESVAVVASPDDRTLLVQRSHPRSLDVYVTSRTALGAPPGERQLIDTAPDRITRSPAGSIVVSTGNRLLVIDLATGVGERIVMTGGDGVDHALATSPDGTLVAARRSVWDTATGAHVATLAGEELPAVEGMLTPFLGRSAEFSPDGTKLALIDGVYDVESGSRLFEIPWLGRVPISVSFTPDGELAATSTSGIAILDPTDGTQSAGPTFAAQLSIARRADRVAWVQNIDAGTTGITHSVALAESLGGPPLWSVDVPDWGRTLLSDDGGAVVYVSDRGELWLFSGIDGARVTGPVPIDSAALFSAGTAVFDAAAARLVTVTGTFVHVWDAATGDEEATIPVCRTVTTAMLSLDGQTVIIATPTEVFAVPVTGT